MFQKNITRNNTFTSLQMSDLKSIYATDYASRYGNLHLGIDMIAFNMSNNSSRHFSFLSYLPRSLDSSNFSKLESPTIDGWAPFTWLDPSADFTLPILIHVKESYTTNFGRDSEIHMSLYFIIVVLVSNLIKLAIMVYTLQSQGLEPLVTLGDAAASFLQRPEVLTDGKCSLQT
jgi:hypothetical protein